MKVLKKAKGGQTERRRGVRDGLGRGEDMAVCAHVILFAWTDADV